VVLHGSAAIHFLPDFTPSTLNPIHSPLCSGYVTNLFTFYSKTPRLVVNNKGVLASFDMEMNSAQSKVQPAGYTSVPQTAMVVTAQPNMVGGGGGVVPLAVAYTPLSNPVFSNLAPITVPAQYRQSNISPELWTVINSSSEFTVRQHVKLLPKQCCKCPCAPQENTYSIYAGNNTGEVEVLRVDEVSDDWNRSCCKPYHPFKLEVRQHIPLPGDVGFSDFGHLNADIQRDFAQYSAPDRSRAAKNFHQQQPVLFSVVRDDGMRCCFRFPCKWLSTYVCCGCCQDGVHLYSGDVPNNQDELGRPLPITENPLIGSVNQPIFGGCCIPFLELRDGPDNATPFGKVAGPCFFGGWLEMCCSFNFPVSYFNSSRQSGDIANIIKKKPVNVTQAAVQCCTEADNFGIKFSEENLGKITPEQKLTVLSSQLLLDYMLFDGNTDKCKDTDSAVICYCCYFSMLGSVTPCCIAIPKNQN
jgi:hypothetical protein